MDWIFIAFCFPRKKKWDSCYFIQLFPLLFHKNPDQWSRRHPCEGHGGLQKNPPEAVELFHQTLYQGLRTIGLISWLHVPSSLQDFSPFLLSWILQKPFSCRVCSLPAWCSYRGCKGSLATDAGHATEPWSCEAAMPDSLELASRAQEGLAPTAPHRCRKQSLLSKHRSSFLFPRWWEETRDLNCHSQTRSLLWAWTKLYL